MSNLDSMIAKVISLGHELDRDQPLPDIEKIAGLFPRGFLSLYAAQAGTGKTWFMQYIACRLSMGGNILAGLVPKSKRMKTVIFAGETGKYLLNKRLQSTCWAYDKSRIKVYDAVELQRNDIPIMLNSEEGRITTLAIMEHEKPDIIFYDTLISFHTADESKQGEMTTIYTFLLKLANEFSPNSRRTQDDVIGSNVGVRLASRVFIAERLQDGITDDEGMPTISVHDEKQWDKRIPDFSYQFIVDPATNLLDFAINWGNTEQSQAWSLRERVRNLVKSHEAGAILKAEDVARELVTSPDNARKYLDELANKRVIARQKLMNASVWRVL